MSWSQSENTKRMSATDTKQHQSSFRDPAGFVFEYKNSVYRQINKAGAKDYEHFMSSGLYEELVNKGWLIPHKEVKPAGIGAHDKRYKIIKPEQLSFISYPYEWTFPQLKDAALLTLKVQKISLKHGMILKDASAYNIQFIGRRPVFIDTLSFWRYKEGDPWEGYRQFCEHFVAPLALAAHNTPEILSSLRGYLGGVPLDIATKLLPRKARLRRGLFAHIYLHAASQKRYDRLDGTQPQKRKRKVSRNALNGLIESLNSSVKRLNIARRSTQWGDYYNDTNYSKSAFNNKKKIVEQMLDRVSPRPNMVWDLGANDSTFSNIAANMGAYTVAFDVDSLAVEQAYSKNDKWNEVLLPLTQDLSNPSPSLGWAHMERHSLEERGPADVMLALALIHHLAITNHLSFSQIAEYFSRLSKHLIIEFVPKGDSKVELLLSAFSHNTFEGYTMENFEAAFSKHFKLIDKKAVKDSKRVIYLFKSTQ